MSHLPDVADAIRTARGDRSRREYADLVGLAPEMIYRYEKRITRPQHIDTIRKLATLGDVPWSALIGTDPDHTLLPATATA